MKRIAAQISPEHRQAAIDWILRHADQPAADLDPAFDADAGERRNARTLHKLSRKDPGFWGDWLEGSGMAALVATQLKEPWLLEHTAFIKRRPGASAVPLHQDVARWRTAHDSAVTFWIALTDARKADGGLFHYPGAGHLHKHGGDARFADFEVITPESDGDVRWDNIRDIEAEAGDVVVWAANTAHGNHANTSNELRVAMPLVFVEKSELLGVAGQRVHAWAAKSLSELFSKMPVPHDRVDEQLLVLKGHSLKMVTFLARFSRQFGTGPKIADFIKSPTIDTLTQSALAGGALA